MTIVPVCFVSKTQAALVNKDSSALRPVHTPKEEEKKEEEGEGH